MSKKTILLSLPLILILNCAGLFGQTDTGRIRGTVLDSTGAVIPGVDVTLLHEATGREVVAVTNDSGVYTSVNLPTGQWRISAALAGFKQTVRSGVVLQVGETVVVDVQLEVGDLTEEIEVVGTGAILETTQGSQSQVIDDRRVVDLPLNGRDYLDLALLSAGTFKSGGAFGGFSANGMRNSQNNFMLDGMDNNNNQAWGASGQGEAVKPSIDAVQEFKVLTSGYSAEYGRAAGGVVNATIKSGANNFHGTGYGFWRHESLDARNLFDTSGEKAQFRRQQYGFSIGGPIVRDKTFFFGDYEATRIQESAFFNSSIPTPAMISGDFSALGGTIYDPMTYDPATNTRQPFPNNIIPDNRIDQIARNLGAFYPAPTGPGLSNNFLFTPPNDQDHDRYDIRIDHIFSAQDTFYGRYSYQEIDALPTLRFPEPLVGGFGARRHNTTSWNTTGVWNHTFSPTLITSNRVGYNKHNTNMQSPVDFNLNALLGIDGLNDQRPGEGASFGFSDFTSVGLGAWMGNYIMGSRNREVKSDTTWIHGDHTLQFGINLLSKWDNQVNPEFAGGAFRFGGVFTRDPVTGTGGSGYADFLLGFPSNSTFGEIQTYSLFAWHNGFYFQDDWKVSPKLTLNLGLRYEMPLHRAEANNFMSNFDIDTDPLNPSFVLANDGSHADRSTVATDRNDFAPRLGWAYQLRPGTVLRGAYGIFYGNEEGGGDSEFMARNPPWSITVNINTDNITPAYKLDEGVPSEEALDYETLQPPKLSSYSRTPLTPYVQQWNLLIQQQLATDWVWEIGYLGNKAHRLFLRREGNPAGARPGNIDENRIYHSILLPSEALARVGQTFDSPGVNLSPLGHSDRFENNANAQYHSFQTKVERRFQAGFGLLASYTFSKTMDDGGCVANQHSNGLCQAQNPFQFLRWALSDQHQKHRFVTSVLWGLPFGRGQRWGSGWGSVHNSLLGGWQVTGIVSANSGLPFNVGITGNPTNATGTSRPNLIGDPNAGGSTIDRWFNTDAFERQPLFTYGSAGRNIITAPGLTTVDFALLKDFAITAISEEARVQFRFEAFNFLNTPPLGRPARSFGVSNFGVIGSAGRPRNLQFGIKFIF